MHPADVSRVHSPALAGPRAHARHADALSRALALEPEAAASILQRQPALLSFTPSVLATRLEDLCASLGGPSASVGSMASKHPEVLLLPPNSLRKRASNLARQMRIPEDAALRCVRKAPHILTQTMQELKERLEETAGALGVDSRALERAARRQPYLYVMPSSLVEAHARQLAALLQLDRLAAAKLLLACPQLLTASDGSLRAKVEALQRAWGLQPSEVSSCVQREPGILEQAPGSMELKAQQLLQQLSRAQLAHMVREEPKLMRMPAASLLQRMQQLEQMLGLKRAGLLQLLMRRPALLRKSASSVSNTYRAVSIWDFSDEFKRQLLHAHPLLLRLAADEVYGRCNWLRTLMMRSAYVHATLRELPPKLLGVLILHLPSCWCRLEYLVDSEQEVGSRLMEALQCSRARWAGLGWGCLCCTRRAARRGGTRLAGERRPAAVAKGLLVQRSVAARGFRASASGASAQPCSRRPQVLRVVPRV
jgi:hypothetical protein